MDWGQVFKGFVPTAMTLDQQQKDEAYRQEQLGIAKAGEKRSQTKFDQDTTDWTRRQGQIKTMDDIANKWRGYKERFRAGDHSFVPEALGPYNKNEGPWADGMTGVFASTPQGPVLHQIKPDGTVAASIPVNEQFFDDAAMQEMKYASPEMFMQRYDKDRSHGLDVRKVGAAETTANAAMQNANTNEGYRNWMQGRPQYQHVGNRLFQFDASGKLTGTHDAPWSPAQAHVGGAGKANNWTPVAMNTDGTITYSRTSPSGQLEFQVSQPTDASGKPIDPKYVKGIGPQRPEKEPPAVHPEAVKAAIAEYPSDPKQQGAWAAKWGPGVVAAAGVGNGNLVIKGAGEGSNNASKKPAVLPPPAASSTLPQWNLDDPGVLNHVLTGAMQGRPDELQVVSNYLENGLIPQHRQRIRDVFKLK